MTPNEGPPEGGMPITVSGHGFEKSPDAACRFARVDPTGKTWSVLSTATFVDIDQIVCLSPQYRLEACLSTTGGCEMILSHTNNGRDYSGGVMGFGGSTLKFDIMSRIPTINMPFYRHEYVTDHTNEVDQYVIGDTTWAVSAAGGTFVTGQQFTAGKSGWLAELKFRMSLASSCNETITVGSCA